MKKVLGSTLSGYPLKNDIVASIESVEYAVQNGIPIVNMSLGGTEYSESERLTMESAMYWSGASQNTLSTAEGNHLKQVYSTRNPESVDDVRNEVQDQSVGLHLEEADRSAKIEDVLTDADTILIGTPEEIISGEGKEVPNSCSIAITKYRVRFTSFLAGKRTDSEIVLSSQLGDILTLGKEYMLIVNDNQSVYYDQCILWSEAGIQEPSFVSDLDVARYIAAVNENQTDNGRGVCFIEEGMPMELKDFADVIVHVNITSVLPRNDSDDDNCDVSAEAITFEKGTATAEELKSLRLIGNIQAGETYKLAVKLHDGDFNQEQISIIDLVPLQTINQ